MNNEMSAGDLKERARECPRCQARNLSATAVWLHLQIHDAPFQHPLTYIPFSQVNDIADVLDAFAERETEQLRSELAKFTENRKVGTCCDCVATIWFREARITDETGTYHPICRVAKKLEAAERELASLKAAQADGWVRVHDGLPKDSDTYWIVVRQENGTRITAEAFFTQIDCQDWNFVGRDRSYGPDVVTHYRKRTLPLPADVDTSIADGVAQAED